MKRFKAFLREDKSWTHKVYSYRSRGWENDPIQKLIATKQFNSPTPFPKEAHEWFWNVMKNVAYGPILAVKPARNMYRDGAGTIYQLE